MSSGARLALVLALATTAAYANTFSVPFLFDDLGSIPGNPTLRDLTRPGVVLSPPPHETVGGRPLLNLTFALNYAVGGTALPGYHGVNLAVHVAAALALFGVLRLTLLLPAIPERLRGAAVPAAFTGALLWALHPIQTSAVTYIVQRAEALAALFYLVGLYAFIRGLGAEGRSRTAWQAGAVASCLLGAFVKETLATAPLTVLLYDVLFGAGSLAGAWRARKGVHLALLATWVVFALSVRHTGGRGGTVALPGLAASLDYAAVQCWAVVQYVRLSWWPHPLVFDYGLDLQPSPAAVVGGGTALALLLTATVLALKRWPAAGFAGAVFFLTLAPTSSLVPVTTELVAEHRMYLPLAALVGLAVSGLYLWREPARATALGLAAGAALGVLTFERNRDYRDAVAIWTDTVTKRPHNSRALNNLGMAWHGAGDPAAAVPFFRRALEVDPTHAEAANNLGGALIDLGRASEALAPLQAAVGRRPAFAAASVNLGTALLALGRPEEAVAEFEAALRARPDFAEAEQGWGRAAAALGRPDEAIEHYEAALRLGAGAPRTLTDLGVALFQLGRFEEAGRRFAEALAIDPGMAAAENGLGAVFARQGRREEARQRFEAALRIRPDDPDAVRNLALLTQGVP